MIDWLPDLAVSDKPRYLAIAELIATDIGNGRLARGDRLPPQRRLADRLHLDFTTIARGYAEARRRGLVEARVGQGTFVCGLPAPIPRPRPVDLSMNLPPEPDDPALIARMQAGLTEIGRDIVALLRYQAFGGSVADKEAASSWLARRSLLPTEDRVFIAPGAHAALLGILATLARPGETVLCEAITYPGIRSITAQRGLSLVGLSMDEHGVHPDALTEACTRLRPKALYLNPTLQNPTTLTIPPERRVALLDVARRFALPVIEDDAYGFIPARTPLPLAALAPDLVWHVAGLAKCVGAGVRAAYVVAPTAQSGWAFAAAVRVANVMASPLTVALATRWIEDGTADALLRFIRTETAARQALAAQILPADGVRADPMSFNLWVTLPQPWSRSAFVGHMRGTGIGVVASDVFTADGTPPEAVRVCLGGPVGRDQVRSALDYMAHALAKAPELALADL